MTKAAASIAPKKKKNSKPSSIIDAIENVVRVSKNSSMSEESLKNAEADINLLVDFFHVTATQAVLLCVIMELGPNDVGYDAIFRFLSISKIRMWSYAKDIEVLVKNRLVHVDKGFRNHNCYELSPALINCVQNNTSFELPKLTGLDAEKFFDLIGVWFDDLKNKFISTKQMQDELNILFDNNSGLTFVKKIREFSLDDDDMLLLTFFCHKVVNEGSNDVGICNINDLYSYRPDYFRAKKLLRNGQNALHSLQLIEFQCEDGVADTDWFRLTETALTELLPEFSLIESTETVTGVLEYEKLVEKKLFFSDSVGRQIADLEGLLEPDNFKKVRDRMAERGLRNGFAVLFYGGPGTGKTEAVYQLARKTGRNIIMVDIPSIRSKWVGDSEKNIKAVFSRYRYLAQKSKVAPILLFNEADAIFGTRKNKADKSVDKMENTMQNIILQEMETLDGILIATTNLQQNLDTAFERRFLYKIKFYKPTEKARASIWHVMIPELSEADVRTLAHRYEFSGGQIENIARHYNIDRVLHEDCGLDMLIKHCDNECLEKKADRPRIGF